MIDIVVPYEQEGTKAIVRGWLKKVGERVEENDPLVELETDKVTQEVPSPASGILEIIHLDTDSEAIPGAILGQLRPVSVPSSASTPANPAHVPSASYAFEPELRLSPAVRRAVLEHALDPAKIAGTGKGGRLTRADVDLFIEHRHQTSAAGPTVQSALESRIVPHDRMRRLIADNMLQSVTTAPHVTAVFEADFTAIMRHRAANKAAFAKQGANLTFTAYFLAAAAAAMRAVPAINSRWHDDHLEIFGDVNIGVGTALGDKGLIVPVVRQVQALSLIDIASKLHDLVSRARDNRLKPADVQGGTFTISNHGVSGSLVATPIIINQPQSAILGVGKLEKRVVVREIDGIDSIQIRPLCYVSLTIDHRVVDGHQTNLWLTTFVETLENWPD